MTHGTTQTAEAQKNCIGRTFLHLLQTGLNKTDKVSKRRFRVTTGGVGKL